MLVVATFISQKAATIHQCTTRNSLGTGMFSKRFNVNSPSLFYEIETLQVYFVQFTFFYRTGTHSSLIVNKF